MSSFPLEPPVSPAAVGPTGDPAHRRELTEQELATLPLQALLVRTGRLTLDQLSEALRENVSTGRPVEEIAVARGWVPAEDLDRLRQAKAAYAPPEQQATRAGCLRRPAPPVAAPVAPPVPAPVAQFEAAPAPARPAPAPAPAPAPVFVASPPPSAATPQSVGVFLHMEDGERVWVGRFESQEAGERHAQQLIDSLMRPEPGVWPRFGDRLVRPESVVGVEVSVRTD